MEQQFDSSKQGMWLFLATEILFFGGLFCAYAVYRAANPEIFMYAHQYLDKVLGGINTAVLILSSFTMAWAVRCAQLSKTRGLVINLIITILCAFAFMGIKYTEYEHKWEDGLLWGTQYNPTKHHGEGHGEEIKGPNGEEIVAGGTMTEPQTAEAAESATPAASDEAAASATGEGSETIRTTLPDAEIGPTGLRSESADAAHGETESPNNVHIFFGIYFAMTGLHGLHVVVGIGLLGWLLVGAMRGAYSASYYTPVDVVGLYWHLVDLIWIYLFPLLYLIH